jgi:hypothetical protein
MKASNTTATLKPKNVKDVVKGEAPVLPKQAENETSKGKQ